MSEDLDFIIDIDCLYLFKKKYIYIRDNILIIFNKEFEAHIEDLSSFKN
jgi:hypothetical protein